MSLSPYPRRAPIVGANGFVTQEWDEWMLNLYNAVTALSAPWTDVPYDADDYSGGQFGVVGAGTMTVNAPESYVLVNRAKKVGAHLWWTVVLFSGADVAIGGVLQNAIRIRLPFGAVAASGAWGQRFPMARVGITGGHDGAAFGAIQQAEPDVLTILRGDATAFGAHPLDVQFSIMVEVEP